MTYDQWMEFLHVTGACLFALIIVAGVGLGAAADVTVFTSRSRKVKQFAAADLVVIGGNGIITFLSGAGDGAECCARGSHQQSDAQFGASHEALSENRS